MELAPHLWALGFGVGVLVGLTGMGGGSVMTPALILLGFRPAVVVGTDLVQMAVTKLLGAAQHLRQGTADWKLSLLLAAGSVPGALTGALILPWWEALGISVDDLLRHLVGGMLVLTACALILGLRRPLGGGLWGQRRWLPLLLGASFLLGLLVAWTSVGSGVLFMALLVTTSPLPAATLVGTDVLHSFLLTLSAGAAHLGIGNVDLALAGHLLVGSLPGVVVGSRLSRRLSHERLRSLVSIVMLAIGVRLL